MADEKVVATNRKARHEYEVLEIFEAGLVLRGTEVKSLREGHVNFKDSYVAFQNSEAWLIGCGRLAGAASTCGSSAPGCSGGPAGNCSSPSSGPLLGSSKAMAEG